MDPSLILENFKIGLSQLRDFPDKKVILDLTRFSEDHLPMAPALVNILVSRLMDPTTNITYRLPTFYLIDSVMKHVGGPYPNLFSRVLGDAFVHSYNEVYCNR